MILDAEATVDKAVRLLGEAAERGAQLAVFPECFVSLYPQEPWTDVDPVLWDRASTTAP